MGHQIVITLLFVCAISASAQNLVLSDDFEGGTGLWQTNGWDTTSTFSFSPTHSFTESPFGFYPNNVVLTATTIPSGWVNLTSFLGARLDLYARWEIEQGFDFCFIEASRDGTFWRST